MPETPADRDSGPRPAPSPASGAAPPPDAGPDGGGPLPRALCDLRALAAADTADAGPAGARWRLAEAGRQLDANLVRLPAGERIDTHTEPDLDVLLLVVSGDGVLGAGHGDRPQPLAEGGLYWLPHGSTRSITAGDAGLGYLTVHRRRPGMRIGRRPAPEA